MANSSQAGTLCTIPQLAAAEGDVSRAVDELKARRRIIGAAPTLEELLNPIEEHEIGNSPYSFEGGDEEIMATVQDKIRIASGETMEADSDSGEEEGDAGGDKIRLNEAIEWCEKLEQVCLTFGTPDTPLDRQWQG
jgi:hypothetical protein